MALDIQMERQQAHALLDQLPPAKLEAVRSLLEVMVDDDEDGDLTEEDRRALRASEDYFRNGGQGIPFEQVVASLGIDQRVPLQAKRRKVTSSPYAVNGPTIVP